MQWDLGLQGWAVLVGISSGFGLFAGLVVGRSWPYRVRAVTIATVTCIVVGAFTSEVMFGWATEEELQPNVDGLSRDEVLLSSALTTTLVIVVLRYLAHRGGRRGGRHEIGRRHRERAGHV